MKIKVKIFSVFNLLFYTHPRIKTFSSSKNMNIIVALPVYGPGINVHWFWCVKVSSYKGMLMCIFFMCVFYVISNIFLIIRS